MVTGWVTSKERKADKLAAIDQWSKFWLSLGARKS